MSTPQIREDRQAWYDYWAQVYMRSLSLENIMEATPQATQRKITLESFDLVHLHRADIQAFNELLLQYPHPTKPRQRPRQVVPDNTVIVWPEPLGDMTSFVMEPGSPIRPFLVLEYVSKHSVRKDYEENMEKYEHELKVPYYLTFYPDNQELTLRHHNGDRYLTVFPNEAERYPIPELELEVALLDGWVRFWFRGKLLALPAELQTALDEARAEADEARQQTDEARRLMDQANRRADHEAEQARQARERATSAQEELDRLRAEIARLRQQGGET